MGRQGCRARGIITRLAHTGRATSSPRGRRHHTQHSCCWGRAHSWGRARCSEVGVELEVVQVAGEAGHDARLLVVAHALLKEVGLAPKVIEWTSEVRSGWSVV
jgi:hypothetical protein